MEIKQAFYKIIYNDLVDKIRRDEYSIGDLLPSESELENMYNISRTPVRQALKQLENDGYIYRLQGKGSFVSNSNPTGKWILTTGFMHKYNKEWQKISVKTLNIKKVKSEEIASLLGINKDNEFYEIERIRLYKNEPVLYLKHNFNPRIPIEIFMHNPEFPSKDQLLKEKINVGILDIQEKIESISANAEIAQNLNIPEKSPVLKVTRISSGKYYNPTDVTIYYVNTDKWDYITHYKSE